MENKKTANPFTEERESSKQNVQEVHKIKRLMNTQVKLRETNIGDENELLNAC